MRLCCAFAFACICVLCAIVLLCVSDVIPSFVLMAVKGSKVVTYVYELRGSEVNVSKSEFIKK